MPKAANITARVYDICGRMIGTLFEGRRQAGTSSIIWNLRDDEGRAVPNGVYILRMSAGGREASRKITVLR